MVVNAVAAPYGPRLVVLATEKKEADPRSPLGLVWNPGSGNGLEKIYTLRAWNARVCDLARFSGPTPIGTISPQELTAFRKRRSVFGG